MRVNIGSGIVSRSMRCLLMSSLYFAVHAAHAAAALDFGYRIDGPANVRPTLVFNDGENTYIQPSATGRTQVVGATADGPYLRLPGIPDSFVARIGSVTMQVHHVGLPSGPTSAPAYGGPQNRIRFTPAVQVAGGDVGPRRDVTANGVPSVKPAGSPTTDAKAAIVGESPAGELRAGGATPVTGAARSPAGESAVPAATVDRDASDVSYLAKAFGADGIREGANGSIQIRFLARPSGGIQFASESGKRLGSSWDDRTRVMTIDPSPTLLVRDGRSSAIVTREVADTFHFPTENAAGLDRVFSEQGSTYLRLVEGTKKVTVRADGKVLKGEQKGRYYRVRGTGDAFVVDADGFEVTVTRSRSVRFNDRAGSSS